MSTGPVVILAGGTGGAKLAAGFYALLGSELTVIANTGDDIEIHGGHVCPDPDLCVFWLAGAIDERGWGLAGDTFAAMDALRARGEDVWFSLGDRDLDLCRRRAAGLTGGGRLTELLLAQCREFGVDADVLPMSDDPVRTTIRSGGRLISLQEFLVAGRGRAPIEEVFYEGAQDAAATPETIAAIERSAVIVIGPSNPILSIAPILAVAEIRAAIEASPAPVVAVSPIVGGEVLKGPTAACLRAAGSEPTGSAVAAYYGPLLDGFLSDDLRIDAMTPHRSHPTMLDTDAARIDTARAVLSFAGSLA